MLRLQCKFMYLCLNIYPVFLYRHMVYASIALVPMNEPRMTWIRYTCRKGQYNKKAREMWIDSAIYRTKNYIFVISNLTVTYSNGCDTLCASGKRPEPFVRTWRIVISFFSLQWRHNECDGVSTIGITIVYSNVCSGADQRKHQISASLAFVRGIYWWTLNSPHRASNMHGKCFHLITSSFESHSCLGVWEVMGTIEPETQWPPVCFQYVVVHLHSQ